MSCPDYVYFTFVETLRAGRCVVKIIANRYPGHGRVTAESSKLSSSSMVAGNFAGYPRWLG